jgi:mono/diheme cytochrome c family protein
MAAGETAAAVRVVDPGQPGDNLPRSGRSQFDRLFASMRGGTAGYDLPFPFAALLDRLDAELVRDPASTLPPAKRVLIPLGRSLQRHAAAPDYFAFPRVVVAVDASPASSSRPFLKDRLYIGYQERSALLEVISYNEAAGRFEFQLVKDYRAGATPQVVYANRTLCLACHQNGAAIFARALWDETNANPRIAALLASQGKRFYGIDPQRGVDVPYAIDIAVKRANGFALTQRLWQEGCGGAEPAALRCRAELFSAALRRALADGRKADIGVSRAGAATLLTVAGSRWPGGLAVGGADIPNRNPLPEPPGQTDGEQRAAPAIEADLAARFDPLLPRPPQQVWRADAGEAIDVLVDGLTEFISSSDRQRLADALVTRSAPVVRLRAPCRHARSAARWSLSCRPAGAVQGPQLAATLAVARGKFSGGRLDRLTLPDGSTLNGIALAATRLTARGVELVPAPRSAARSADGSALTRIIVDFGPGDTGDLLVELRQEFPAVQNAVAELLDSADGELLFGPRPLPREALIAALLARLGAAPRTPCCQAAGKLPPPQLDAPANPPQSPLRNTLPTGAQAFYPYCAACHQGSETAPPNFLRGSAEQVAAALRECAPRLYVRLAMADLAPQRRAKTPMPPEALLPAFATDIAGWRASPVRAALLGEVGAWLHAETGEPPELTRLLEGGYEALRPCLPAPQETRRTP